MKYWVDFLASVKIEAKDVKEAEEKAYELLDSQFSFCEVMAVEEEDK